MCRCTIQAPDLYLSLHDVEYERMARIGFIGASGLMGHGIARNLQLKGHTLALTLHRRRDTVADLLGAGAREHETPAALAADSEFVFVCVTGSPQVEAVV